MLGLDPAIVDHHINTWIDASPIHQKQRLMHPTKSLDIKAEIDKIHLLNTHLRSPTLSPSPKIGYDPRMHGLLGSELSMSQRKLPYSIHLSNH